LDHPQRAFGGLYHCAKSTQHIFRLHQFGWKTIQAPKIGDFGGFDPLNSSFGGKTSYDVQIVEIGLPVQPVLVTKRPKNRKKERQKKKPNSGKLGIHRDHPSRRIEMKFCMVGGLWKVVLRFEFHQNRLSGFGAMWGSKFALSH